MNQSEYKIAVYIFYFGKWPEWIELYFSTLKKNKTIDFHVFTDCGVVEIADNIFYHEITLDNYSNFISKKIGIDFKPSSSIKLCDIRPLIGYLHRDLFKDYHFYGWADVDLIFGDIRSFYTDELLKNYDVFSSHEVRVAGHFSIFRNNSKNRNIYKKIYNWKEALLSLDFVGIDEHGITNALTMSFLDKFSEKFNFSKNYLVNNWLRRIKKRRLYFVEQFSTPFTSIPWIDGTLDSNQPSTWYYNSGVITNSRDINRNFMYLHFMNFKSSKWRYDGTTAPWGSKIVLENLDLDLPIQISNEGIKNLMSFE